jgi:nucleotide-binding universal stress UspA family protein
MFEKVLVALDFSPSSQKILDHIDEIPGIQEVELLHVVDATHPSRRGWTHGPHIENAKLLMAEKKEALELLGLKVTTTDDVIVNAITQGTVSMSILETAETKNVSLIIVGARGINPIQELLLGSVSSSVLRHAKTNVLVMHAGHEQAKADLSTGKSHRQLFSKVLVPTDFSQPAGDAFSLIKSIPGMREIVLLHVVNHADSQPEINDCVSEAQLRLEDMKKEFIGRDVVVTHHIRVGDPTEMILSVAQEDDVSLIAMSACGTNWLREILLGSTTFTVVRRAKKPVLVIRTGQETKNPQ